MVADRDHGLGEGRGARPAEAHALVAGHVHDQAAAREGAQLAGGDEHQRRVGVLQHAVDHDVVPGEEVRQRYPAGVRQGVTAAGVAGVTLEVNHARGVDRGGDRVDVAVGQDVDVVHAVRVEGGHRPAAGGPEADDGRAEPAAVFARHPDELERMQHRAVTGQFVVLVKDMQTERAVRIPVVHRLKGDQGQPPLDAQLGDLPVLDTVRPAPQDLPVPHLREVLGLRFGQQDDIAFREELVAGAKPGHQRGQLVIGHAEPLAVAVLEIDTFAQTGVDPPDVQRMDREPLLVLLP